MERVPTLKSELETIVNKYGKGHIIATTACIGGELGTSIQKLEEAELNNNIEQRNFWYQNIVNFIQFCIKVFGEDFYIECAPSAFSDQILVNKRALKIARYFNIKVVVGTDAHYLTKEDRYIHEAYLNSKGGEREVASFYSFARLMDNEECYSLLTKSYSEEEVNEIFKNSLEVQNKITFFSLEKKQIIPKVEVDNYPKTTGWFSEENTRYPLLKALCLSDEIQERYWVNECLTSLQEKNLWNSEYLDRLETEADVIKYIGEKLDDCLFAYFNTFKHYIDLFWECGSIVGPGRGSATGFLSNYLLGITQLDPVRWGLPYWRLTLIRT